MKHRIYAIQSYALYVDIEAENEEKAIEIAENVQDDGWTEDRDLSDWEIIGCVKV